MYLFVLKTEKMSVKKLKRWSDSEKKTLISEIEKTPTNLRSAFERTAKTLGRSNSSVEGQYYCIVKNEAKEVVRTRSTKAIGRVNVKNTLRKTVKQKVVKQEKRQGLSGSVGALLGKAIERLSDGEKLQLIKGLL